MAQKIVQKVVQSNEGSTLSISLANISHLAIAFPTVRQKHWKAFEKKFGAFPCNMARDSVGSKLKKIKKQCIAARKWHCKLTTLYSISLLTWVVDGSTGFCQRKCVTSIKDYLRYVKLTWFALKRSMTRLNNTIFSAATLEHLNLSFIQSLSPWSQC